MFRVCAMRPNAPLPACSSLNSELFAHQNTHTRTHQNQTKPLPFSHVLIRIMDIHIIEVRVGRDSAVGTATRYGLDGPGIEYRWGRDFPHPSRPVSYTVGTGSFPGVKRPGRGLDHLPRYSAEVKERVKLYINSTSWPAWPFIRWTLWPHSDCKTVRQEHNFKCKSSNSWRPRCTVYIANWHIFTWK